MADHDLQQDFQRVTKEPRFPAGASARSKDGNARVYCRHAGGSYTLRGIHTKLNVIWDWEHPAGAGDTHFAFYRGTRARVKSVKARPNASGGTLQ